MGNFKFQNLILIVTAKKLRKSDIIKAAGPKFGNVTGQCMHIENYKQHQQFEKYQFLA